MRLHDAPPPLPTSSIFCSSRASCPQLIGSLKYPSPIAQHAEAAIDSDCPNLDLRQRDRSKSRTSQCLDRNRVILMAPSRHLRVALLICAVILGVARYGEAATHTKLSSLSQTTLVVTVALPGGKPFPALGLQTAQDFIEVSWKVNTTAPLVKARRVQIKLCFAIESQVERVWRRTDDDLARDKTCQFEIASADYSTGGASATVLLPDNVPRGKYFVRAYALDADGLPVGYGQSSPDKISNVFSVIPISGRSRTMVIAAVTLSILSVSCLMGFLVLEHTLLKKKSS